MKVFSTAILMVFCSLLASAFSIQCQRCSSPDPLLCFGKKIDCPIGDQCMTSSQSHQIGLVQFNTYSRGCADTNQCGAYCSLTQNPYIKLRSYTSCCTGDNCNNGPFYIPPDDTTPNGVKCPSSFCAGTDKECNTDLKMMECRGSETCCIEYRGQIGIGVDIPLDYSGKGCVNPEGCNRNFQCFPGLYEKKRVLLKCCDVVKP